MTNRQRAELIFNEHRYSSVGNLKEQMALLDAIEEALIAAEQRGYEEGYSDCEILKEVRHGG